jgi:hypothetical protein
MANAKLDLKVNVDSVASTKQFQKATIAAKKLIAELEKLQEIKIEIQVVEVKKKWWQFFKH